MKKRKTIALVLAAAMSAVLLSGCGGGTASNTGTPSDGSVSNSGTSNDVVTLKYDLTVSLEHPWGLAATEFKNRLEEKSGGRFQVEIYPSSTSGSEADSLAGMLVGTTSMTMTGGSFSGYAPSAALLEAPWAYDSEEDVQAMVESEIGTQIKQDFEAQKFHVLWYQLRGARELTSNVPINTPADLSGRTMRMSGVVLHTNMWNAAGAITSSIALSETFNALSQGVVEMQENPYDMIYDNSFYEVQKYVNETNHVYSTIFNVINSDLYNSLDDDMRNWLDETSAEMQTWVNDYYYAHRDEYKQMCIDAGMTINEDVDRDALSEAMMPAIEQFLEEQGNGLLDMYRQIRELSASNN